MLPFRPVWLSDDDIDDLIDPVALVEALAAGFAAIGRATMLEQASVTMPALDGASAYLSLFPANDRESGLASVKVLVGRPENAAEGRPEIDAIVALAEAGTGSFRAILSAAGLTALRTAAVTALAIRAMIGAGAHRIGLVGTGQQAKAHARILAANGLASGFLVASPAKGAERAVAFAQEIKALTGLPADPLALGTIARSSDVLITMTLAERPLPLGPLPDGLLLACIGPFLPHSHEIDPRWLTRAALVVSDWPERLMRQWQDSPLLDTGQLSLLALGDLLEEKRPAEKRGGFSIFLSDGRAFEDNVIATLLLRAATQTGRGLPLP
jgi:ornithine cyclodeaminase/alanine dehydrogenase-like protein (mu-crystallin family)